MKSLLLGNSHTGCILKACKESGRELDAYAVPGGLGPDLEIKNGYVRKGSRHGKDPKTNIPNGLSDGIRLSDYDDIIFSTLGSADPQFANKNHPLVQFARADMIVDPDSKFQLVSKEFVEALIEEFVVGMFATESLKALSKTFGNPIYVQPVPVPLRSFLDQKITPTVAQYGENATKILSWYFEYQFSVLENIVGELGPHVQLLPYPDFEAVRNGFSSDEFDVSQTNPWHMPTKYGALVLSEVDTLRRDRGAGGR